MQNNSIFERIRAWIADLRYYLNIHSDSGGAMRPILRDIASTYTNLKSAQNISAIIKLDPQEDNHYSITIQYYYKQLEYIYTRTSNLQLFKIDQFPLFIRNELKNNGCLEMTLMPDELKELVKASSKKIGAPIRFKTMLERILHTHVNEIRAITISDHIFYYKVNAQFLDRIDEYYFSMIHNIPEKEAAVLANNRSITFSF